MQILYHCKKLDDFRNLDSQVQSDLPRMITCPYMPSECHYCYQLEVGKMQSSLGNSIHN